ncbi:hypothetical protein [Candidatus Agathobaculum pullicola]|uniref:hypothetical protein n=1 Tax=Candidatus Agathobaculum pullicola TaxID=2838426 RepID=UPI003F916D82
MKIKYHSEIISGLVFVIVAAILWLLSHDKKEIVITRETFYSQGFRLSNGPPYTICPVFWMDVQRQARFHHRHTQHKNLPQTGTACNAVSPAKVMLETDYNPSYGIFG